MKKSEQYQTACLAVLDHELIAPKAKLEILETLMADRRLALYAEEPISEQTSGDVNVEGTVMLTKQMVIHEEAATE
jgi:hypothetical protein